MGLTQELEFDFDGSIGSASSSVKGRRDVLCECGLLCVLKTAWKGEEPGRRFWGCKNSTADGSKSCKFGEWFDPPMCERSKKLIQGLLNSLNAKKMKTQAEKKKVAMLEEMMVLAEEKMKILENKANLVEEKGKKEKPRMKMMKAGAAMWKQYCQYMCMAIGVLITMPFS